MKVQRSSPVFLTLLSLLLLITMMGGSWGTAYGATIPTFDIVTVQADQSISIKTANFPANDTFQVMMGEIGTRAVDGILVDTLHSGSGGTFTANLNIPAALKGKKQISVRLQSAASGYYSYNWFWNSTGGVPVTGATPTKAPTSGPTATPVPNATAVFSISSVVVNQTVTITTKGFPANDTFQVLMGKIGTRGVDGVKVDSFNSGSGGVFAKTFNIPAELKDQRQIAIRLESTTSGHYSYNWFWNNTGSSGIPNTGVSSPTATPGTTTWVVPTFSISGVSADSTVTIKTANFPASDSFDVLMGKFGTRGVGGVKVDTVNSGAGGTLSLTFTIPAELKGQSLIAIRLQSPTSGYYSYNWFLNK